MRLRTAAKPKKSGAKVELRLKRDQITHRAVGIWKFVNDDLVNNFYVDAFHMYLVHKLREHPKGSLTFRQLWELCPYRWYDQLFEIPEILKTDKKSLKRITLFLEGDGLGTPPDAVVSIGARGKKEYAYLSKISRKDRDELMRTGELILNRTRKKDNKKEMSSIIRLIERLLSGEISCERFANAFIRMMYHCTYMHVDISFRSGGDVLGRLDSACNMYYDKPTEDSGAVYDDELIADAKKTLQKLKAMVKEAPPKTKGQ